MEQASRHARAWRIGSSVPGPRPLRVLAGSATASCRTIREGQGKPRAEYAFLGAICLYYNQPNMGKGFRKSGGAGGFACRSGPIGKNGRRNRLPHLFCSVLLPIAFPAAALPQPTQALISGRILDVQTGNPIPDAQVSCEGISITPLGAVRSDSSGYFILPLLSPGQYQMRVGAAKYQPQEVYELELAVASRIDFVFRLRPLSDVWEQGRYRSVLFPESESLLTFF